MRDSLTVYEGVIYKGNKALIPKAMQAEMLTRIHKSHQGAESCIRKARDVLFWVGMTAQIRDACASCSVCAAYAVQHQREPMLSHLAPDLPWQKISQDIFYLQGKSYLVTVDHYSDFVEVDQLKDSSSESVILASKQQFARHGIPQFVITDNGAAFASHEYTAFSKNYEFEHTTNSPYYSQGNGREEAAVKSVKMFLKNHPFSTFKFSILSPSILTSSSACI